ncbi:MAG: neutral zinc metallopeptidase [Planctomycetes bacterium]|nr:neutral zinc metallopeptidase [Planctomycetota bacterium]
MDLSGVSESSNVEDRRGMKTAGGLVAGGGGLLVLILGLVFGVDLNKLGVTGGGPEQGGPPPNDNYKQFAGKVLTTLEDVWTKEFAKRSNGYGNTTYEKPHMVLFSKGVNTGGCGFAPSEVGPFYCPADKVIYLDPSFFDELEQKLRGSKGEFSQAYVIAHENGHHVQNLLGYSARVDSKRKTRQENEYSIRLELQADYLAGVWAYHGQKQFNFIKPGDVDDALTTAKAIGDDRIMQKMGRKPWPESFNHGTSEQRLASFTSGMRTGNATKAKLDEFFTVSFDPHSAELDSAVFR